MSDTFETHRQRLDEFREKLKYVEGAVGAAVAVGGKVVAIDLFDKPTTCGRVWNRLLSGAILDALELQQAEKQADRSDVERVLVGLRNLSWESAQSVGGRRVSGGIPDWRPRLGTGVRWHARPR